MAAHRPLAPLLLVGWLTLASCDEDAPDVPGREPSESDAATSSATPGHAADADAGHPGDTADAGRVTDLLDAAMREPIDGAALPLVGDGGCDLVSGPCEEPRARGCDEAEVVCKRARPTCLGTFEVPEVVDGCWGACVPIESCACGPSLDCPQPEQFVCHRHAGRCGPYVN